MSTARQVARPLKTCFNGPNSSLQLRNATLRAFSTSPCLTDGASSEQASATRAPILDPNLPTTKTQELELIKLTGKYPIGSRRRRAALQNSGNTPFEQLPFQCFQEARKVLREDREEKIQQIEATRQRIATITAQDAAVSGGEQQKQNRLRSMHNYLEKLKIFADINDPLVKKRFEDGEGDMNKPIYRYLADRDWRKYRRLIIMQRITQMHVVPDVLPSIDPTAEVSLAFGRRKVKPGEFVDSVVSERPGKLDVQVFNKGERLVTVVVVDSDVPNLDKDTFDHRCHFLASNLEISPTITSVSLASVDPKTQLVLPWLPPHAQKGSPYHRLSVFVLEQPEGKMINTEAAGQETQHNGFVLRSFMNKHRLSPVGVTMFRTKWDESMATVMQRNGIDGWDVELKRKRVEPLPYKKKDGARYR